MTSAGMVIDPWPLLRNDASDGGRQGLHLVVHGRSGGVVPECLASLPDLLAQRRSAPVQLEVLTAEQMARYDQLAQERQSRRNEVRRGQVWVEVEGGIQARPVGLGLSDGQYTQIMGRGLEAGTEVVTRVRESE